MKKKITMYHKDTSHIGGKKNQNTNSQDRQKKNYRIGETKKIEATLGKKIKLPTQKTDKIST